jgi:5-formyltetrahydrofolate cyclo-ligase
MAGQPRAQHRDQQQVEQSVENCFLPRLVPGDLLAEHRKERRVPLIGRRDHEPGQDRKQLPADLAVPLVGADQHGGRPGRAVPPGA